MRPRLQFLDEKLIDRIVDEALDVLATLGLNVQNDNALMLLTDHGAAVDDATGRVTIPGDLVTECVDRAPNGFPLFDVTGAQTHDLAGDSVHFTPGSSGITVLDHESGEMRTPVTRDFVRFAKLTKASTLES